MRVNVVDTMRRAWSGWVARCARLEDKTSLGLLRILIPLPILWDLIQVGREGLVGVIYRSQDVGGLVGRSEPLLWVTHLSPTWGGPITWGVAIVACTLVSLGVATRPAIVVLLVSYSQLGLLFPPGDRGIDRILRTVLLILLFSGCHHSLALGGRSRQAQIPAWPGDLIRYLLVLVYLAAGLGKIFSNPRWLAWSGTPVLYRIMVDPIAGSVPMDISTTWFWPLRIMGWATIVLECSAPLLLTQYARWWAIPAAAMHVGIALTMDLGMFSWGMLSLYPVVLHKEVPHIVSNIRVRWCRTRTRLDVEDRP